MKLKTIIFQATVAADYDISGLGDQFRDLIEARGGMATGVDGYAVHHEATEEVDAEHRIYPAGVPR